MEDALACTETLEFETTDDDCNAKDNDEDSENKLSENHLEGATDDNAASHQAIKEKEIGDDAATKDVGAPSSTIEISDPRTLQNGSLEPPNVKEEPQDATEKVTDSNPGVDGKTASDLPNLKDVLKCMEKALKETIQDWNINVVAATEESNATSATEDLMQDGEMAASNEDDGEDDDEKAKVDTEEDDEDDNGVAKGESPTPVGGLMESLTETPTDVTSHDPGDDKPGDDPEEEAVPKDNEDTGPLPVTLTCPDGPTDVTSHDPSDDKPGDDPEEEAVPNDNEDTGPLPVKLTCSDGTIIKQEQSVASLFKCNLCEKDFITSQALEAHQLLAHMTGEEKYQCKVCNEEFDCQSDLLLHRHLDEDDDGEEKEEMESAEDEPRVKEEPESGLDGEEEAVAEEEEGEESDGEEDVSRRNDENWVPLIPRIPLSHQRKYKRKRPKTPGTTVKLPLREQKGKFKCSLCPKTFHSRCHVKVHERTHTKEKPCHCMHCAKTFSDPSCLTRHVRRIHHTEPVWHCMYCLSRQYTYSEFTTHRDKCHAHKMYRCCKCSVVFADERELAKHGLQCIGNPDPHIKPIAMTYRLGMAIPASATAKLATSPAPAAKITTVDSSKLQKSPGQLRVKLHKLNIHESDKNRLSLTFSDDEEIDLIVSADPDNPCKCRYCPSAFSNPYTLFQHVMGSHKDKMPADSHSDEDDESSQSQKHPESEGSSSEDEGSSPKDKELTSDVLKKIKLYCRACNAAYDDMTELIKHEEQTHDLYGPALGCYKCPICFKRFTRVYHVSKHLKRSLCGAKATKDVPTPVNLYLSCQYCPTRFTDQHLLEEHEKTCQDHLVEGELYKCIFCDHHFLKAHHRDKHIDMEHKDAFKYKCEECPQMFTAELTLMNHKATMHCVQPDRPFRCPDCNSDFKSYSNMSKHRQLHMESSAGRKFKCPHCLVAFKASNHLARHIHGVHKDIIAADGSAAKKVDQLSAETDDDQDPDATGGNGEGAEDKQVDIKMEYQSGSDDDDDENNRTNTGIRYKCGTCKSFSTSDENELRRHLESHGIPTNNTRKKDDGKSYYGGDKPFQCRICKKRFKSMITMKRHRNVHTREKSECCPYCEKSYYNKYSLAAHISRCKKKNASNSDESESEDEEGVDSSSELPEAQPRITTSLQCRYCSKVFKSSPYVRIHERMHEGIKPHKCAFCSNAYSDGAALNKHLRVKHGVANRTVAAEKVRKGEVVPENLPSYQEAHARPFQCKKCLKYMESAGRMKRHKCFIQHKCMFCTKSYVDAPSLNRHLRVKHGIQNRSAAASILNVGFEELNSTFQKVDIPVDLPSGSYRCKCSKSFKTLEMLVAHQRTHRCSTCNKWYTRMPDLQLHERSHYVKCKVCERGFQYEYLLTRHMKTHFRCAVCTNSFNSEDDLARHMKSHALTLDYNREHTKCTVGDCEEEFEEALQLHDHMRHEHKESYVPRKICRFCEKQFMCTRHVLVHERTHTGEKPHHCPKCRMGFADPSCLHRHVKKQHNIIKTPSSYKMYAARMRARHQEKEANENEEEGRSTTPDSGAKSDEENQGSSPQDDETPERKECRLCGQRFRKVYDRIRHEQNIHKNELHLLQPENDDDGSDEGEIYIDVEDETVDLEENEEQPPAASDDDDDDDDDGGQPMDDDPSWSDEELYTARATATRKKDSRSPSNSFMCKTCKFRFPDKDALIKHEITHQARKVEEDEEDDGDNRCQYCSWSFDSKVKLAEHVLIHTTIDPFKCSECQMSFASNRILQDHKNLQHATPSSSHPKGGAKQSAKGSAKLSPAGGSKQSPAKDDKLFSCPFCTIKMSSKAKLVAHIMTHSHEDEDEEEDNKEKETATEKVPPPSYACNKCGETFTAKARCQLHKLNRHGMRKRGPYRKLAILNEEDVKRYGKAFACGRCNQGFPTEEEKLEHEKTHTSKRKVHRCNQCHHTFTNIIKLYEHRANAHVGEDQYLHRCKFCNKPYRKKQSLHYHMQMFHRINEEDVIYTETRKKFHCHVCKKSFERKWVMHAHIKEMHKEVDLRKDLGLGKYKPSKRRPFSCPICDRGFTTASIRNRHVRTAAMHDKDWELRHEVLKQDEYKLEIQDKKVPITSRKQLHHCKICRKTFRLQRLLALHTMTHHKVHQCDICNKKFSTSELLKRHTAILHKDTRSPRVRAGRPPKESQCDICTKKFESFQLLKTHINTVHKSAEAERGRERPSREVKVYGCNTCEETFSSSALLKRHQNSSHKSSEAPKARGRPLKARGSPPKRRGRPPKARVTVLYNCDVCNSDFTTGVDLKKHLIKEHKASRVELKARARAAGKKWKQLHTCPVCKKRYNERSTLNRHVRTIHKMVDYQLNTRMLKNMKTEPNVKKEK